MLCLASLLKKITKAGTLSRILGFAMGRQFADKVM